MLPSQAWLGQRQLDDKGDPVPSNLRHSPEVLRTLSGFDTATISNAIEKLALRDRATGYVRAALLE